MIRNYHIQINGKVNNRGYKLSTMLVANEHKIKGFVSEKPNRIDILAEGEEPNLKAFLLSCKKYLLQDENNILIMNEGPLAYYDEFTIK